MSPFSRAWVKVNKKTWRNTVSGFVICNESYQSINGRWQKSYCVYMTAKAQDAGEVISIQDGFYKARAKANAIFDKLRSQASGR